MSLAFGSAGAVSAAGTTSLSVPYPASISAGDLLVMCIANKVPTNAPTTPALWTLVGRFLGGSGAAGSNQGDTYISVYTTVAVGTETGNLAVTITSGNSAGGRMFRYTGSGSYSTAIVGGDAEFNWTVATITEVDPSTPLSSIGVAPGDMMLVCYASNSARIDLTSTTLTMSGVTFGTANVRTTANSDKFAVGNNVSLYVNERAVSTGTTTAVPTVKITNTSQGSDDPSGGLALLRIRDTGGGGTSHAGAADLTATVALAGAGALTGSGAVALTATATLAGAGGIPYAGASTLTATATLAATGGKVNPGAAALDAPTTLNAAGGLVASGATALTATSTLSAAGVLVAAGASALAAAVALNADGQLTGGGTSHSGAAALTAAVILAGAAGAIRSGSSDLTAALTLTGAGNRSLGGAAALTTTSTLGATGSVNYTASAALSASVILTAIATSLDISIIEPTRAVIAAQYAHAIFGSGARVIIDSNLATFKIGNDEP